MGCDGVRGFGFCRLPIDTMTRIGGYTAVVGAQPVGG
jgi:hypothetical protein